MIVGSHKFVKGELGPVSYLKIFGIGLLASLVVLVIVGALASSPVYAAQGITIWVNPPNPVGNGDIQFVGWINPSLGSSQQYSIVISKGFGCNDPILTIGPGPTDSTGSTYNTGVMGPLGTGTFSSIGPGEYSAMAQISNPSLSSSCHTFVVFASLPTTVTLTINPANPAGNSTVQFQGTITPAINSASNRELDVILFPGNICGLYGVGGFTGTTDSTGSTYSVSVTLGSGRASRVGPGTWSAIVSLAGTNAWSGCVNFTVSAPVPEFPIGLPILFLFVLIACGQITRRATRRHQSESERQ